MTTALLLAALAVAQPQPTPTPQPPKPVAVEQPQGDPKPDAKPDDKAEKKDAKWDVSAPGYSEGVWKDVPIDTDEGTWMNLDLSADGKTIVFDLLGDLYTVPVTGGEATNIQPGIQWDMLPRFSPDGAKIAFTSDRTGEGGKGGDNIWTISRQPDGTWGKPVQISKESYRLVTQPAWTPDGQYIVGRKHFTSRRSLGAGEMWLYHVSGKLDGLQMTTKPTDQKDVGEPVFSPDGKYLYYSLDATPGGSFEYDKDPNPGIFAIDRLDREKGETTRLISGPGGACRPTPSPDGKSIAFVRRVRYVTTLFVYDLASGQARPVYDKMERDMQEAWSIHGVSPTMAWTPDNKSIIAWAAGKIRKIDVATGKADTIAIHVKDSRRVAQALRFKQEPTPAEFDVKMLQNATVSPKGDQVVYQALGHLYVRSLPEGTPRRLTTQSKDFEFFPAFSRDGSQIVYVSWNDETLGAVRIIASTGGEQGKALTTEPGHYADPAITPDGATVVFGKVSGGYLLSPLFSREPGLYKVSAQGGAAPTFVTREGTTPQFGAASDRVFLTVRNPEKDSDKVSLVSVDLASGKDQRQHYHSDWATEFRVSPDGAKLAFIERFNVFVTPFIATGRAIDIGPKAGNTPVTRVSKEAGQFLHWSGDSGKLHWTLGPDLYTVTVGDPAMKPADPEAKPEPPVATAANISFKAKTDVPTGEITLAHADVITMKGDEVLKNQTLTIRNNRIASIEPSKPGLPAGAVDCTGKTIVPGFIDVHAHGPQGQNGITPQHNWSASANLAFGVTTIHDPSNDTEMIFASSELQRAGMLVEPRTFSTGTILYGASGSYRTEVDSLDDALFHLRRMKAVGAFSVKSYNQPRRDQRQQIIQAGRQLGMMVMPEGGSLYNVNMSMVVDGHSTVEHTLPVQHIYKDAAQLWGASDTGYVATLLVAYGGMGAENYWYAHSPVYENAHLLQFFPKQILDPRSRRRTMAPEDEYNHWQAASIPRMITDAGGRAHMGAHGQLSGLGYHWEMWSHGGPHGMTPMQILHAATINGAHDIGMDQDLGSVEVGKLADLVILDKNPLDNIQNTESVRMVMLNGRLYDAATLAQLAPTKTPAPTFWFHKLEAGRMMISSNVISGCAGCSRTGGACLPGLIEEHPGPTGYR